MMTDQGEIGIAMVKGRVAPSVGVVAGTAIGSELAIVGVVGGMAGVTIRGSALILSVAMAGLTLKSGVPAG